MYCVSATTHVRTQAQRNARSTNGPPSHLSFPLHTFHMWHLTPFSYLIILYIFSKIKN